MHPNPKFWTGKRVCVTGGSGFLGFHIVRQLVTLGAHVKVLSLPPGQQHPLHRELIVEKFFGDICDQTTVRRAVADCDVVFHTAGIVAVAGPALARIHSVHVNGTRNVLETVDPRALVIHTSSVVTIGAARGPESLDEECRFNLDDIDVDYVAAKRAAETLALQAAEAGHNVIITNPAYLVGPEDYERSELGRFSCRFWRGQLWLAPPGGYNFVDVRDVASGHLLAAEHGMSGRRYILGGENHSFSSFFTILADVGGLRPRAILPMPQWTLTAFAALAEGHARVADKVPFPSFQQARLNRYHWFYRSDRAMQELGYRPRSLRSSLTDTLRWHQSRGLAPMGRLNRWWMRPVKAA
jgi:dihydroflavonol-4-reductase